MTMRRRGEPGAAGLKPMYSARAARQWRQSSPFRERDERPVSNTNTLREISDEPKWFRCRRCLGRPLGGVQLRREGGHSQGHNTRPFLTASCCAKLQCKSQWTQTHTTRCEKNSNHFHIFIREIFDIRTHILIFIRGSIQNSKSLSINFRGPTP